MDVCLVMVHGALRSLVLVPFERGAGAWCLAVVPLKGLCYADISGGAWCLMVDVPGAGAISWCM